MNEAFHTQWEKWRMLLHDGRSAVSHIALPRTFPLTNVFQESVMFTFSFPVLSSYPYSPNFFLPALLSPFFFYLYSAFHIFLASFLLSVNVFPVFFHVIIFFHICSSLFHFSILLSTKSHKRIDNLLHLIYLARGK